MEKLLVPAEGQVATEAAVVQWLQRAAEVRAEGAEVKQRPWLLRYGRRRARGLPVHTGTDDASGADEEREVITVMAMLRRSW
jgi:hypothetical protein